MKLKLLFLALTVSGFVQSQNLLQNGSFETFTTTTPNSWNIIYGTTLQENTNVSTGNSSLKATAVGTESMSPAFGLKQEFTLSDTETYTLKFDYFVPSNGLPSFMNISNLTYEITKITSGGAIFAPPPANPVTIEYGVWKTITYDFKIALFMAPTTSVTMAVNFIASSMMENNSIYFDNVVIAKKSTLSTTKFVEKKSPVALISQNEIKLDNNYINSEYQIYSIDGKIVKSSKINLNSSIEISDLIKGIYILKLKENQEGIKFIKQ